MRLINQILSFDNLRAAWEEVAENKGAPGIDRVSIKRWSWNWEERLVALAEAVRSNQYKASKLRRFSIPKKDGTRRWMAILTVDDRVIQRATLRVVDNYFDKDFKDCSYGYRVRRGVREAIPAILDLRDGGRTWVLDADIDDCFNSLDHALLLEFFQQTVDDSVVLNLLRQWLAAGSGDPEKSTGITLGSVISPLLCNIMLHRLDSFLLDGGFHLVRYADDFCVFCSSHEEAERATIATGCVLDRLKLRFEPSKTSITNFESGFKFLGIRFYRDTYSFTAQEKRIEVKGAFDPDLFHDYVPEGYQ